VNGLSTIGVAIYRVLAHWDKCARGDGLSGVEGLLAVVGLEMTTEGIRTGTDMERWRERVPDFTG